MLLASCSDGFKGSGSSNFANDSAEWFNYLEYNTASERDTVKKINGFDFSTKYSRVVEINDDLGLMYIETYDIPSQLTARYDETDTSIILDYYCTADVKCEVIDLITQETLWQATTKRELNFSNTTYPYYANLEKLESYGAFETEYSVDFYGTVGFFRVTTETPGIPTEEEPTPAPTYSYALYDITGAELLKSDEIISVSTALHESYSSYTLYEAAVGDKKYIVNEDFEIIYVMDAFVGGTQNTDRKLPEITHDLGDCKYAVKESDNKIVIQIFDKDYKLTSEWSKACDYAETYLLGSGKLLVLCNYMLADDADDHDFIFDGEKIRIDSYIVDAEAKETEVELPAYVAELVTSIDTYKSFKVKNGYNLVVGSKVNDLRLDTSYSYYIVDDDMNVIAELPTLVAGQCGIPEFVNESEFNVEVLTSASEEWNYEYYDYEIVKNYSSYAVVAGYDAPIAAGNSKYRIENGFFCNGVIYNNRFERLVELESYSDIQVKGDCFVVATSGSSYYVWSVTADGYPDSDYYSNLSRYEFVGQDFYKYSDSGYDYYCSFYGTHLDSFSTYSASTSFEDFTRGGETVYMVNYDYGFGNTYYLYK